MSSFCPQGQAVEVWEVDTCFSPCKVKYLIACILPLAKQAASGVVQKLTVKKESSSPFLSSLSSIQLGLLLQFGVPPAAFYKTQEEKTNQNYTVQMECHISSEGSCQPAVRLMGKALFQS